MEPDQQGKALKPEEVVVEAEAAAAVLEQAPANTVYAQIKCSKCGAEMTRE